jgi:hypothetical protein
MLALFAAASVRNPFNNTSFSVPPAETTFNVHIPVRRR